MPAGPSLAVRSPRTVLRAAQVTLGLVLVNVVSGAAVRLSDSGLGCPDWPTCTRRRLTAPLALHPAIEFANRVVVLVLVVGALATLFVTWARSRRVDLRVASAGLLVGIFGEAVLGGLVVYSKLNPYVVMSHFLFGMVLVADAVMLVLLLQRPPGRGALVVSRRQLWATRGLLALVGVVLAAGSASTGAGPHAGGRGAKRIPVPLDDVVRIHSGLVLVLAAGTVGLVLWLARTGAPQLVSRRAQMLLAVLVAQGLVGYVQFFTHLPPLLVGVHEAGACAVWGTALWLYDDLHRHRARDRDSEVADTPLGGAAEAAVATVGVAGAGAAG